MTREEKCKLAIKKGYTYDSDTGHVLNKHGKILLGESGRGYIKIVMLVENKCINLKGHHFAWYLINKESVKEIDHINGIRDDNRICNLRSVTRQQNQWNRTTAKGYYLDKRTNKFNSQIYLNRKRIRLGYFNTEQEARTAYLQAKEKYHII